jgi:hypothetical protein
MNIKTKELQEKHLVSVRKERSTLTVAQGREMPIRDFFAGSAREFPSGSIP